MSKGAFPNHRVVSPAKLNLMLHITGRRPDGYHELQTLFQLLAYGDEMDFQLTAQPQIDLHSQINIPVQDNLIWRAAQMLLPRRKNTHGVRITLHKHLPLGGGVGGGSSNAATTLLMLNTLWACELSTDQLAELGQALGADVPVFVRGHSAWAEGIGEALTPVTLPEQWFLVACPSVSVSTAAIFQHPGLTRNSQITTIRTALAGGGRNDCETTVRALYPEIQRMLDRLAAWGTARLTGTGGCGFVSFADQDAATEAAADMASEYRVFVAQGVNRSPVLTYLETLP
ncbi:4-(cytidine 5'-diphospho)-2-C-methyl-D-erythritol kinase [Salinispirillum marinum]|uniref:4-diphosphocytidyl-2-C-methyl-D-erythritol kinase n=2 Tax=Saccharospirillaceae TaxID=255527 RepID=A0ABV8BGR3_9GAMM